jgi:hypothetical protein
MFCLLYSPKQKIVKFHAQKQIGKSHVIDIFTSEVSWISSLCIFQYLTLYYIINRKYVTARAIYCTLSTITSQISTYSEPHFQNELPFALIIDVIIDRMN